MAHAHYLVYKRHIQQEEFFEERIPVPPSYCHNLNESLDFFHRFAKKNDFDRWVDKHYWDSKGYYEKSDSRDTLMFR